MTHHKFTIVLESDAELDPSAMSEKMQTLINALVKDMPGMKLSGASMVDVILTLNAAKAFLNDANISLAASDGAAVLMNASGTHFWQYAGDYWANAQDLLAANVIYHTQAAMEAAEGDMKSPA